MGRTILAWGSLARVGRGLVAIAALPLIAAARFQDPVPPPPTRAAVPDSSFARLVARLSEPGGFFDTDNLISNEASYLHVMGGLRRLGVSGGAYIGVGPDQNFSYIALIRPRIAYLIDIRRDNLLQHLLFRALFEMARSRTEYLALLFAKPMPAELRADPRAWDDRPLAQIVAYLDSVPGRRALFDDTRALVERAVHRFGVPVDARDLAKIAANHEAFFAGGLDLRFTSLGRPVRSYYPTYRQLILERDREGRPSSFLADEEGFRFVKSLETRGLVVPVVGDLAGSHAMHEIARHITERGDRVSALYTSNVEFYLMRGEGAGSNAAFDRFARNVTLLPHDTHGVIIRSYFGGGFGQPHPQNVNGYLSTQMLQPIDFFVRAYQAGELSTYWDVVTRGLVEERD